MENNNINNNDVSELEPQITFDKLQDKIDYLFHEYKKMHKKNVLLQSKVGTISKDFDVLQNEKDALSTMNIDFKRQLDSLKNTPNSSNENLVKENEIFKMWTIDLNSILTKFTKEKENLDRLLGNQRSMFEKSDVGYKPMKNEKNLINLLC